MLHRSTARRKKENTLWRSLTCELSKIYETIASLKLEKSIVKTEQQVIKNWSEVKNLEFYGQH